MSTVSGDGMLRRVRQRRNLRSTLGRTVAAVAVAAAAVALDGAAVAAQPSDDGEGGGRLTVSARTGDPAQARLVLRNVGDAPCQVADTTLGTVTLVRVTQDGVDIPPSLIDVNADEPLDVHLETRLRVLDPGQRLEIPLSTAPMGPTGLGLTAFAWSAHLPTVGALYPVTPDRPLVVELTYALPETVTVDGPPLCPPAAGATGGDAGPGGGAPVWWLLVAGAVLVVAAGAASPAPPPWSC